MYQKILAPYILSTLASGPHSFSISGIVYDSDGATAVEGATVALGSYSTTSAVNGAYTISNIPAGTSGSMTCTKAGYSWTALTVSTMSGNLTNQNYSNAWWATGGIAASCVRAYKPIGASSLASSYINLANPGIGDASPGIAPIWNASYGWNFNGTNQYVDSGVLISESSCIIMRFTTAATVSSGCHNGFGYFGFEPTSNKVYYGKGGFALSSIVGVSGVLAIAAQKGYINGVEDKTIPTGNYPTTRSIYIGAINQNGSVGGYTEFRTQVWAMYSADITSQIIALTAAINALP